MPAIHYPSQDEQGPFTAKVASGRGKWQVIMYATPFNQVSKAVQWCRRERSRLLVIRPKRRWVGTVLDKNHCTTHIAF